MKTATKIFSFIIISFLIGEIENQMVAQLELVQPVVQPMVHPMVQPMVQPYPYLVTIPSYGQVNNYRYGIIRYFIKIILVFITYH